MENWNMTIFMSPEVEKDFLNKRKCKSYRKRLVILTLGISAPKKT